MKYWTEVIAIGAVVGVLAIAVLSRQSDESRSSDVPKSNDTSGKPAAIDLKWIM